MSSDSSDEDLPDAATILKQARLRRLQIVESTSTPVSNDKISDGRAWESRRARRSPTHISDSEDEFVRINRIRRRLVAETSSDESDDNDGDGAVLAEAPKDRRKTLTTIALPLNDTPPPAPPACYLPPVSPFTSARRKARLNTVDPNQGVLHFEPTPPRQQLRILHKKKRPETATIDLTMSSSEDEEDGYAPVTPGPRRTLAPTTPAGVTPSFASKQPTPLKKATLSEADRQRLPQELVAELNDRVFGRNWDGLRLLPGMSEGLPSGLTITWNARLSKTAGQAKWKRHRSMSGRDRHETSIELSTKVVDTEEKLRHTLAHELCHLAVWTISDMSKENHGPTFKQWAARVMKVRPDITVTTTHSYEIQYKYRWQCIMPLCGRIFGRHSASIDSERHVCACGGRLVSIDRDGNEKTPAKKTAYQEFSQVESPKIRREHPGIAFAEVSRLVAQRWKAQKEAAAKAKVEQDTSDVAAALGNLAL